MQENFKKGKRFTTEMFSYFRIELLTNFQKQVFSLHMKSKVRYHLLCFLKKEKNDFTILDSVTSGAQVFFPHGGWSSNPGDPSQSLASTFSDTTGSGFFLVAVHQSLSRYPHPNGQKYSIVRWAIIESSNLIWYYVTYIHENAMLQEETYLYVLPNAIILVLEHYLTKIKSADGHDYVHMIESTITI